MLSHRGRKVSVRACSLGGFALAAACFSACATYEAPQLNSKDGSIEDGGGGANSSAGMSSGGIPNAAGGDSATAGSGVAGDSTGGTSAGTAGSGVVVGGSSGMSSGTAGSGVAGSGTGGSGTGGSGVAGSGTGGSGVAGSGTAGSGTAGSGTAGASMGGSGGSASTINPCTRTNWTATASAFSDSTTNTGLHNPPAFGIDGDQNTRWSLGAFQVGGEWYKVDLGAKATHLTQVVLDTTKDPGDTPAAYKLELSDNGTTWTQVATGTGATVTTINFADHGGRYIRVTQTGVSNTAWWTIHEFSIVCVP